MPLPQHDELLGGQTFQADRSAGVNLVGADADLRAEAVPHGYSVVTPSRVQSII